MKTTASHFLVAAFLIFSASFLSAASNENFGGEFNVRNFLGGSAVFQITITQNGNEAQVAFDAAYKDGHGAAPEADGRGKISGGTLKFSFEDTFGNRGTGSLTRSGDGLILSLDTTHVAEARCLAFYRQKIQLSPSGKN